MLAVLACLISQVVQHLLRTEVLTGYLLGVHKPLAYRQELVLIHFNHLRQLTLLLIQACVLLLFLSELRCGVQQQLEVLRITTTLKKVDLC